MGCRHYFVVDRLEDLVGEGGSRSSSRSSRAREFSACFTTECGNPDILKSMSSSSNGVDEPVGCPITTGLPVLTRSVSTSLSVTLSHNGPLRSKNSITVWLGWLVDFCLSSNFRTQFLHPIMSQGNLRRRSRWFNYFFVFDSSSFHPNGFRDTNRLAVYRNEW